MSSPRSAAARLLIVLLVTFLSSRFATAQSLSPAAQVSLLTFGPGEDLYSVFGHTAIRISDPAQGFDRVYGYGQFDFRTDNFYVKFLRGTLPYQIGVDDMYSTLYAYQLDNRSIREQVLNLSAGQRQRLFDALETNLRPENREYRYKFYYDNCATRPRDMIVAAAGDSLRFPSKDQSTGKSYRDWMNDYLGEKPWARLGMNLAIGYPADEPTTGWTSMYLPDNVFNQVATARIRQADGREVPLVARTQTLFTPNKPFRETPSLLALPETFFFVLLAGVLYLTYRQRKERRAGVWLDNILFGTAGFWGWFLALLWFGTDHGVTAWNPTLLWLFPLHLPLYFWVMRPANNHWRKTYFTVTIVLIGLGLILSNAPGASPTLFALALVWRSVFRLQTPTNQPAQPHEATNA